MPRTAFVRNSVKETKKHEVSYKICVLLDYYCSMQEKMVSQLVERIRKNNRVWPAPASE